MPLTQQAAPHLTYLQCEQAAAAALPEPQHGSGGAGSDALSRWFTAESFLLNAQDLRAFVGGEFVRTRPWVGSFFEGEASSQRGLLSKMSRPEAGRETAPFYPETTAVFVHGGWTLGENSGPPLHKQTPKGAPSVVQSTEVSTAPQRLDLDSLEEKLPQRTGDRHLERPSSEEPPPWQDADASEIVAAVSTDGEETVEEVVAPSCQNKAIAFIMGCPCSDDSQSEYSENGDDGFSSEGSSDLSLSSDEDEELSDSEDEGEEEVDGDSERLWSSLCRSIDPYNPQNFTASQHTGSVLASTSPPSAQSSPASSPPSSCQDSWDDSSSSSEVDEESVRLWSSFSCSSDPYSPFNFTAPLRTRRPRPIGTMAPQTRAFPAVSPPEYRKDEAEERLDSGFSELLTSSSSPPNTKQTCRRNKKVRFCDQVEEFFASCGEEEEDRRGPWEELARDRCRFLRRCQEVEQSIAYCLQPQHRRRVFQSLTVLHDT
ncbi:protein phosphatase 1 regulatory subunit 15B [Xenentodon cancila]